MAETTIEEKTETTTTETTTAAGFEPITSQEQLNKIVGQRIKEVKEKTEEKYADYNHIKLRLETAEKEREKMKAELETMRAAAAAAADEKNALNEKITAFEIRDKKISIARETGLPVELAPRLNGSTDEELSADARALLKTIQRRSAPPLAETEQTGENVFKELLQNLRGV